MKIIQLETPRLLLREGRVEDAARIATYLTANHAFHAPFEPERPADYFTKQYWEKRIPEDLQHTQDGKSLRLYLLEKPLLDVPIGVIHFSNITRGVFQACHVGYDLGEHHQKKGFMTEGLGKAIEFIFTDWNLHRIMAAHLTDNPSSGSVLRRLGFTVEGTARKYLQIKGDWRDHTLTSLVNEKWRAV